MSTNFTESSYIRPHFYKSLLLGELCVGIYETAVLTVPAVAQPGQGDRLVTPWPGPPRMDLLFLYSTITQGNVVSPWPEMYSVPEVERHKVSCDRDELLGQTEI